MGMTIDTAIPKIQFVRNALNDDMEIAKAYDLAISTMRKYQKIEDIYYHQSGEALENSLRAVIEDGKID
jgi:hypothetical protein